MCLVNKYVSSVQRQRASVCEKERKARSSAARNLAIVGFSLGLLSCAKSGSGAQEAAAEPFRRIQEQEQQVALGQAALDEARDCDKARDTSEAQICQASERLCGVAAGLKDRDAAARCQNAQDSCTGAREHVASLCATNAPPP
jgi:hypothetical protein